MRKYLILSLLTVLLVTSCDKQIELNTQERAAADTLGINYDTLTELKNKPLYEFNEKDLDIYLPYLQYTLPELSDRVQHLARKNLGQKYDIYLLGEYPVEIYDPQPLYNLKNSDCVVFCEHIYSMALAQDWKSFFAILQRVRYKDGVISYVTRNHYGDYDWWRSNDWLVKDISRDLVGDAVALDTMKVNKGRFFKKHDVPYTMEKDSLIWEYVPLDKVEEILPQLQTADIVNVVRGYGNAAWVGHFGMVDTDEDGMRYFLHSTEPEVIRQEFSEVVERYTKLNKEKMAENEVIFAENKAAIAYNDSVMALGEDQRPELKKWESPHVLLLGYKFLRLKDNPVKNITAPGQELQLKVVACDPYAEKSSHIDSVLNRKF